MSGKRVRDIFDGFVHGNQKSQFTKTDENEHTEMAAESFEERKRKLFAAMESGAEESKKRKTGMFGKRTVAMSFNAMYIGSKTQDLKNPQSKMTSMTFATILPIYPYSTAELSEIDVKTNGGYYDIANVCFQLHGTEKAPPAPVGQKAIQMPLSPQVVTQVWRNLHKSFFYVDTHR